MRTVECGPRDVIWLGEHIRIFVASRLDDMSLLVVTAPRGLVLRSVCGLVRTAAVDDDRVSCVVLLSSGDRFEIAGAVVRLEDCDVLDDGATPLRDRLLHIDGPPGLRVMRDARVLGASDTPRARGRGRG